MWPRRVIPTNRFARCVGTFARQIVAGVPSSDIVSAAGTHRSPGSLPVLRASMTAPESVGRSRTSSIQAVRPGRPRRPALHGRRGLRTLMPVVRPRSRTPTTARTSGGPPRASAARPGHEVPGVDTSAIQGEREDALSKSSTDTQTYFVASAACQQDSPIEQRFVFRRIDDS